jgi:hypothetical protein
MKMGKRGDSQRKFIRVRTGACAKNKNELDDDSNNMKVLLQLANESYLVSSETTKRVQEVVPSDRYITVMPVRDTPDHPVLGQGQRPASVFERARQRQDDDPLTDREKTIARRWAKHMTRRQQPKRK